MCVKDELEIETHFLSTVLSGCFAYSEGNELITSDKISFQNRVIMGSSCLIRREFGAELEIVLGWSSCPREAAVTHPKVLGSIPEALPRCRVVFALPTAHSAFNSLEFVVPGLLSRGKLQLQPYITSQVGKTNLVFPSNS